MPDNTFSNFIISLGLLTLMGLLAYFISSIDTIIDIAAGLFGVPMIYLFPSLACLKKNMHKSSTKQMLLKLWTAFWVVFIAINLVKIGLSMFKKEEIAAPVVKAVDQAVKN